MKKNCTNGKPVEVRFIISAYACHHTDGDGADGGLKKFAEDIYKDYKDDLDERFDDKSLTVKSYCDNFRFKDGVDVEVR